MRRKILAISGSLPAASSNVAVLCAAALVAPEDIEVDVFTGVAELPHFNPDLDVDPFRNPFECFGIRSDRPTRC